VDVPGCKNYIAEHWGSVLPPILSIPQVGTAFSVEFEADIVFTNAGSVTMQAVADDGIEVTVNNMPVVSDLTQHGLVTYTQPNVDVKAGKNRVLVKYANTGGFAELRLGFWSRPTNGMPIVVPIASTLSTTYLDNTQISNISGISARSLDGTLGNFYVDPSAGKVSYSGANACSLNYKLASETTAPLAAGTASDGLVQYLAIPSIGIRRFAWAIVPGLGCGVSIGQLAIPGLTNPTYLAARPSDGALFISEDAANGRVLMYHPGTKTVTTILGAAAPGNFGLNASTYNAGRPAGLAVNGDYLYVAYPGDATTVGHIVRVDLSTGNPTTMVIEEIVGSSTIARYFTGGTQNFMPYETGNNVFGELTLAHPKDLALTASGNLLFTDALVPVVRRWSAEFGEVDTVIGNGSDGNPNGNSDGPIHIPITLTVNGQYVYLGETTTSGGSGTSVVVLKYGPWNL
jgi:hypothetical protein